MDILIETRKFINSIVSQLSSEQFLKIPDGFKTNILWNIGHLVASQQILNYSLSSITPHVPEKFLNQFRKGTSPASIDNTYEITEVISLFLELPELMKQDYEKGLFVNFKPYTTSTGIILNNIDDAVSYNTLHEGIHTGIIQCIIKLI
ncbi:MAG: DinB family protein [Spirochaetia bacterium]|nr:DinB family protein [Spirochaetia bacterium]